MRHPALLPGLLALLLLLAGAPLHAQHAISIGATILPTVGDGDVAPVAVGVTGGGIEVVNGQATLHPALLRATHVASAPAAPGPLTRGMVLGTPQRTDAVRDAAQVRAGLKEGAGEVRLVHTTVLVVDA